MFMDDRIESLKIVDFGLAINTKGKTVYGKCGTPGYISPEALNGKAYNCVADMFSAGSILYFM
jgi:serine/threonine protein kinase